MYNKENTAASLNVGQMPDTVQISKSLCTLPASQHFRQAHWFFFYKQVNFVQL